MGDGVERALARASELETLVQNEVAALERAYSDNEVRVRGLIKDLVNQRDTLVAQAEQVRSAISNVHIDLTQDLSTISDLVGQQVSEAAQSITQSLAEKGEHITLALGRVGDNMVQQFERPRRRFDRAPGDRKRGDLARDRHSQRTAHPQPQFQGRPRHRGVRRDRRRPGRHDDGAARSRHRRLLGKIAGDPRHDERPFAGADRQLHHAGAGPHREHHRHVEPPRRDDRDAGRRGQQHAEGVRRVAHPRPQSARRRRRHQARADRQPHHRGDRLPRQQGHGFVPRPRRAPRRGHRRRRRCGEGDAGDAARRVRGHVQPFRRRARRKDLARFLDAWQPHHPPPRRIRPDGEDLRLRSRRTARRAHPGNHRIAAQLRRQLRHPRHLEVDRGHHRAAAAARTLRRGARQPHPDAHRGAVQPGHGHRQDAHRRRQGNRHRARQAHQRRHRGDRHARSKARRDRRRPHRRHRQGAGHARASRLPTRSTAASRNSRSFWSGAPKR